MTLDENLGPCRSFTHPESSSNTGNARGAYLHPDVWPGACKITLRETNFSPKSLLPLVHVTRLVQGPGEVARERAFRFSARKKIMRKIPAAAIALVTL